MPRRPLYLLPRDPSIPVPTISAPELSESLAKTWRSWHASDPPLDGSDDFDDPDVQVRDLAQREVEAVWDELDPTATTTGEIISYEIFPPLVDGYRPRRLTPLG